MTTSPGAGPSPLRLGAAWGVHLLTASGALVGILALLAATAGDFRRACLWMLLAIVIDAVDGTLARAAAVKEVLPGIDGRRLDDLVDFFNYVLVPAVFLTLSGSVSSWLWAVAPVLASAYGFCQADAKTEDHFFVGFPSYWNVVAIYAWALALDPQLTGGILLGLAAAVFVPLRYLYPSRTAPLWRLTNLGAALWTVLIAAALAFPDAFGELPLVEASLLYPAYYLAASLVVGGLQRRGPRKR